MSKNTKKQIKSAAPSDAKQIAIEQPKVLSVFLEVKGTAELIQNKFSQKAIEEMLKKHMGISVQKSPKRPRQVIENATIRNTENAVCIPPAAFKAAMLTASTQLKALKKTQLRTQLFVEGGSIPIKYDEMVPRMDMTRTSGMARTPDVRFRPSFVGWSARLGIQFADTLTVQSVVDLLNRAGSVGVGEWRPEKNGSFGTFLVSRHISEPEEIEEVRAACAPSLQRPQIPTWALDADIDPGLLQKIFDEQGSAEPESEEVEEASELTHRANGASA